MTDKPAPLKDDSIENHAIRNVAAAAYDSQRTNERTAKNDTARSLPTATIDPQGITFGPTESATPAKPSTFKPSMLQSQMMDSVKAQGTPGDTPWNLQFMPRNTGNPLSEGEQRKNGYLDCGPVSNFLASGVEAIPLVGRNLVDASGACSEITQKTGPGTDGKNYVETTYDQSRVLDVKGTGGEADQQVDNVRTEFDPQTGNLNRHYKFTANVPDLTQHIRPDGTISTDKEPFQFPRSISIPTGPTKIESDGSRNQPSSFMPVTAVASIYKPDGTHSTDYDIDNRNTVRVQYKSDGTVERSENLPLTNSARQAPLPNSVSPGTAVSDAAGEPSHFSPSMLQSQILDPVKTQGNPELNPYHLHDMPAWTGHSLSYGETRQNGYLNCGPVKGVLTSAASYIPDVGERLVNASGVCSEVTQKAGPGTDGKKFVETTYLGSKILDVKAADGESNKSVFKVRTEFDPTTGELNRHYSFDPDTPDLIQHVAPDGTISTDKETFEEPRTIAVPTGPTKIEPNGSRNEPREFMQVTAAASTYKPDGTHSTDYDIANKGTIHVQYKSDGSVERSETLATAD